MILLFPPLTKSYVPAHIRKLADGRVVLVSAHHRKGDRKDTATRGLFDDHPPHRDAGQARRRQAKPKPVPVVFRGKPKRSDTASSPSAREQLTLPFGDGHNARTQSTNARSAGETGRPKMDEHDGFTAGRHGPATLSLGDKGRLVLTIPPSAVTTALQRKLTAAGFTEQAGGEWWQTKPKGKVEGQGFQRLPRTEDQKAKIQQVLDFLADPKKSAKAADKDKVQSGKHGLLTVERPFDTGNFRLTHDQRFDDKTHAAIKRMGGKWREGGWDVPGDLEAKLAGFLRRHHKAHADEAAALEAARQVEVEKTAAAVEQSDLEPGRYGIARMRLGTRGDGRKGYVVDFPYDPDFVAAVKQGTDAVFQPKQKNWFVPGGHEAALRQFLDKATAEGERREAARQKAEEADRAERAERVKREESATPKQRRLFPLRAMPPTGVPVRLGKKVVVYTGTGKPFTIDEDAPSMGNPHLLGHEGERGAYAYYRDATPEEVADLEHRETARDARREVAEQARNLAKHVQDSGTRPDPAKGQQVVQGETLLDTQTIYGGGDWWVIQPDKIWYIRNNGADGDNWVVNNVRTGGAGAIGWYVPYSDELARELRAAEKTMGEKA